MGKWNCFDEGRTDEYLNLNSDKNKKEVYQMSDEEIMTCDFNEWCDYLYEKYKVLPIILYEENMEQTITETKVKKYDPFFSSRIYDQEYFLIDGVNITYKIPYDGDGSLLHLKPTNYWIYDNFDVNFLEAPYDEQCGLIEISLDYTNKELHDKGQQMQEYVRDNFGNKFRNYRIIIGHINTEVNSYNDKLKEYILKCLDKRKQRATSINLISKMLEIPLKKSKNAPNVHPITLERITRVPIAKPTKKVLPNEYSISDKDYENINNIILMNGTTMNKQLEHIIKMMKKSYVIIY